jgi:hypothetical protein
MLDIITETSKADLSTELMDIDTEEDTASISTTDYREAIEDSKPKLPSLSLFKKIVGRSKSESQLAQISTEMKNQGRSNSPAKKKLPAIRDISEDAHLYRLNFM